MPEPYATLCARVYTRTGRKAHLLPPFASPNTCLTALCGLCPEYFETWRGTGSQAETEHAASLPVCRYCLKRVTAEDEAGRRLAGLGRQERVS